MVKARLPTIRIPLGSGNRTIFGFRPTVSTWSRASTTRCSARENLPTQYISIFDKDEVNIYDATNTVITVSHEAILRDWRDNTIGLWQISLVSDLQSFNTQTSLSNRCLQELLAASPPPPPLANPDKTVNNVYELTTTPELI